MRAMDPAVPAGAPAVGEPVDGRPSLWDIFLPQRPPLAVRYGFAVLAAATAVALADLVGSVFSPRTFLILLPAVVLSAWYGGLGAGLLGILLVVAGGGWLLGPAAGAFVIRDPEVLALVLLLGTSLLVSFAAGALRRSRLQTATAAERMRRLQQATAELSRALPRDEVLDAIIAQAVEATGAYMGAVAELAPDGREFVLLRHRGLAPEVAAAYARYPADAQLPVGDAARTGRPVFVRSPEAWRARYPTSPTRDGRPVDDGAWAALPLVVDGGMLGALTLSFARRRAFQPAEREFMAALAAQCAQALERARLHEEVRGTAERLRAVVETAVDGIITIDEAGTIETVNPATERIFGYARDELVGRNVRVLMPDPYRSEHDGYLARYLETGDPRVIGIGREVVGRRKDGTEFPVDLAVSETPLPERRLFTGIVRDATERKRSEAALRDVNARLERTVRELEARTAEAEAARAAAEAANLAKSQFLGVMSHELRTPLNSVIGYADLLLMETRGRLSEGQREQAERIKSSARHQLGLIEEILSYVRLEAGRDELRLMPVDVARAIRDVAEFVRPEAERRGLAIALDLPGKAGLHAVTDPGKLRQVLLNLAGNAVKFTEAGSVTLGAADEGDVLVLRVRDTGPGVPPELRGRIWEPFAQGDSSRTRQVGGTGLGLAIVRRLVDLMGARIELESQPGRGSTFTVRLPASPRF